MGGGSNAAFIHVQQTLIWAKLLLGMADGELLAESAMGTDSMVRQAGAVGGSTWGAHPRCNCSVPVHPTPCPAAVLRVLTIMPTIDVIQTAQAVAAASRRGPAGGEDVRTKRAVRELGVLLTAAKASRRTCDVHACALGCCISFPHAVLLVQWVASRSHVRARSKRLKAGPILTL